MNTPPRKIPETGLYGPVWAEFNRMIDYIREISPVAGRGMKLSRNTNGTLFTVEQGRLATVGIRQYRLVSTQNDFHTCNAWDGTTAAEGEIYIARPFEHRAGNFHLQTIAYSSDGDVFNASFNYASPTKRTKTINGTAEEQVLTPLYKSDFTIIYAIECLDPITVGPSNTPLTDPNDQVITLLDLNLDGRAWTKSA